MTATLTHVSDETLAILPNVGDRVIYHGTLGVAYAEVTSVDGIICGCDIPRVTLAVLIPPTWLAVEGIGLEAIGYTVSGLETPLSRVRRKSYTILS